MGHRRIHARINLDVIRENMNKMHSMTDPATKMFAVVKTDAYGHGATQVASVMETLDYVAGYAVATVKEAVDLRKTVKKTILILGYTFPEDYEDIIDNDITPAFFREDNIDVLNAAAAKRGIVKKVHVKVDTGMGRIGITPDDTGLAFVKKVLEAPNLELEGIFTHFARADETTKDNALKQFNTFTGFIDRIEKELGYHIPIKHCSNSASILTFREANMDVVRPGITIYGLSPSEDVPADKYGIKPALSLYSTITFIKEIEKGTAVSYGGTFVADKTMRIATVPVGYGDGYPRSLSNKGYCLIKGKRAPIVGRVCMDQMMVDVTDIPEATMDDEVVLIGSSGSETITADELGRLSGRFNYELVCDLGKRVERIY